MTCRQVFGQHAGALPPPRLLRVCEACRNDVSWVPVSISD